MTGTLGTYVHFDVFSIGWHRKYLITNLTLLKQMFTHMA